MKERRRRQQQSIGTHRQMPVSYANGESIRIELNHLPKEAEAKDPLICAMMHSQPPVVKLKRRKYTSHSIPSIAPLLILIIG